MFAEFSYAKWAGAPFAGAKLLRGRVASTATDYLRGRREQAGFRDALAAVRTIHSSTIAGSKAGSSTSYSSTSQSFRPSLHPKAGV
jgi:hypothetical protein